MTIPRFVLCVALIMIAVEVTRTGRSFPKVATWWTRAVLLNGFQVAVAYLSGFLWDSAFQHLHPWSVDTLGVTGGAIVGYLVITFIC